MKLLKIDHYVVTRQLFEDFDGTLVELEIDSYGRHFYHRFDDEDDKREEILRTWEVESKKDFSDSSGFFGPKAPILPGY